MARAVVSTVFHSEDWDMGLQDKRLKKALEIPECLGSSKMGLSPWHSWGAPPPYLLPLGPTELGTPLAGAALSC